MTIKGLSSLLECYLAIYVANHFMHNNVSELVHLTFSSGKMLYFMCNGTSKVCSYFGGR